jgi:hypothetical protein
MKRFLATFVFLAASMISAMTLAIVPARAFDLMQPSTYPAGLNPHNWPFTLFPIPEVATDPNGGVTYGLLLAALFKNKNGDIQDILAPDVNNNSELGAGGNVRFFAYPDENTQWYALAGAQQNIARVVDLSYSTGRTRERWWSFDGRFFFERDPTERFFGLGNGSRLGGESNYTTEQVYGKGIFGWNLNQKLQLALVFKPRYVRILDGAFTTIAQTTNRYPKLKGIGGGSDIYSEMRATYDSRDSIDISRAGSLALLYAGFADRRFLSSTSYTRMGGELRHYWSFYKRFTLAAHTYLQYMPAGNEPAFWTMGWLGGDHALLYDEETLRGYGSGRFIDDNLFVANVELRTRVFETNIFGTHGIAELAPFFEAGRVFHHMTQNPFEALHPVGGMGFRAIAEPFVVGYVDVGFGGEGAAVFSGINYPF